MFGQKTGVTFSLKLTLSLTLILNFLKMNYRFKIKTKKLVIPLTYSKTKMETKVSNVRTGPVNAGETFVNATRRLFH